MNYSSYVKDGQKKAEDAIVDDSGQTIWAETLPPNTSVQKAELIALIQALEQAKGKRVTIFTDSQYAFSTAHIQGHPHTMKGDLGQLRGRKSKICPRFAGSWKLSNCPGH